MSLLSQILIIFLSMIYAQQNEYKEISEWDAEQTQLTTGSCTDCNLSPQAKWYFENEIIAPIPTAPSSAVTLPKWLEVLPTINDDIPLWIASPDLIDQANLDDSGQSISIADGQQIGFKTVPRIPQNQSFWNQDTSEFFKKRDIRLRGEIIADEFIARTVWPLDFAITNYQLLPLSQDEDLQTLVQADDGGVQQPHQSRLLWEREPGAALESTGKAVFGLMLNGAQGDDDEALAGHFAGVTGKFNADGSYHDWLVTNFYNLDTVSEKAIIAAVTPMDNYLADLNAGQNYYRPSYMLFATLKDGQPTAEFQQSINQVMNHFYRHNFIYNHADANCTGITIDTLRALGWKVPTRGINGYVMAIGAYFYTAITEADLDAARQIYDYLTTETTRLLPAVAFDAIGEDLLRLTATEPPRSLTDYEQRLTESIEAIWFVRIPQIPSSRALGGAPIYSFSEYLETAPADRDDWVTIELADRDIPPALKVDKPVNPKPHPLPWTIVVILLGLTGLFIVLLRWLLKAFFSRNKTLR
ncbi:hypothetical protein [Methylophaga sp.]|uniref:hypothetical protein n=1 Tax=Methylophaga sp. TaxID=2024840 RepID=UPI00272166EB|nr:hypothetical protein [Methylophaga sp.]MDO8827903.1 hypothetical protein [Methylophaga sp.]